MRVLSAGVLLLLVVAGLFLAMRWRVRRFPHLRRRIMVSGGAVSVLGVLCVAWLPALVPETPGSPATTVGIVVLWVVGGCLLILGVSALLGAAFSPRAAAEAGKVGSPPS